jgi:anti-sigma factor RsiW
MPDCSDYERLIARVVDDPERVGAEERRSLDGHLEACPSCRAALEDQRAVAAALSVRPPSLPRAGFQSRVAARVDADRSWLPLVNWRAWTVGLTPVAAGLLLAAWLMPSTSTSATSTATATSAQTAPASFDTWAASNLGASGAAFLESDTTGDSLLELVLTGKTGSAGGGSDVR